MFPERAFECPDGILLNDLAGSLSGTFDPSVTGQEAPVGTLFLRTNGSVFQKIPTPAIPISFRSSTEAQSPSFQVTIAVPAGVVDGDSLVLIGTQSDGEDGSFNALAGWTEEVIDAPSGGAAPSTPITSIYTRKASSEPANYNLSVDNPGGVGVVAKMLAFDGSDPSVVFDVAAVLATHTGTANPNPPLSNTPVTADSMAVAIWWHDDDLGVYGSVPAGYTDPDGLGSIVTSGGGNGCSMGCAFKLLSGTVAENPGAFDVTDADEGGSATIIIRSGANGGGSTDFDWVELPQVLGVFGTQYQTAASLGTSSTTSATFQEKLSFTTSNLPAGDYVIFWNTEIGNNDEETAVEQRVQLDNSLDLNEIKPQVGRETVGEWSHEGSGHSVQTLTGVHDIDIDFNTGGEGGTAFIREARITLWRVT